LAGCETKRSGEDIKITKDDMSNSVGEEKIDLGGKTITFEYVNQRISDNALEEINKKIGTKYNCRMEWKNISSDYYHYELIPDIISGVYKGEVIYVDYSIQPFFSIVEAGALTALDEYINFEEGFFNNPIQERALWNGKHYGLSSFSGLYYESNLLYYNKHLIEQKGLPDILNFNKEGSGRGKHSPIYCEMLLRIGMAMV